MGLWDVQVRRGYLGDEEAIVDVNWLWQQVGAESRQLGATW